MWKVSKVIFVSIILSTLCAFGLNAQQWTDAQKEVWEAVKTYNDLASQGDIQGYLSYFDESYSGWYYAIDAPGDKEQVITYTNYFLPNNKTLLQTLTPAKIWVNGDFAYVHYYYTELSEDKDGKKEWEKGRWTDILMKKDGKWIMVGDHGGETK